MGQAEERGRGRGGREGTREKTALVQNCIFFRAFLLSLSLSPLHIFLFCMNRDKILAKVTFDSPIQRIYSSPFSNAVVVICNNADGILFTQEGKKKLLFNSNFTIDVLILSKIICVISYFHDLNCAYLSTYCILTGELSLRRVLRFPSVGLVPTFVKQILLPPNFRNVPSSNSSNLAKNQKEEEKKKKEQEQEQEQEQGEFVFIYFAGSQLIEQFSSRTLILENTFGVPSFVPVPLRLHLNFPFPNARNISGGLELIAVENATFFNYLTSHARRKIGIGIVTSFFDSPSEIYLFNFPSQSWRRVQQESKKMSAEYLCSTSLTCYFPLGVASCSLLICNSFCKLFDDELESRTEGEVKRSPEDKKRKQEQENNSNEIYYSLEHLLTCRNFVGQENTQQQQQQFAASFDGITYRLVTCFRQDCQRKEKLKKTLLFGIHAAVFVMLVVYFLAVKNV